LVTDAANNDLAAVTPAGRRLGTEAVSTDHLPADQKPPVASINAEAVPTTVAIGPDGYAYVGQLGGCRP
jgi:hypothetical protein